MGADQGINRLRTQKRDIPVEHQQLTLKALEGSHQLLNGMACSVLRLLEHKFEPTNGAELRFHPFSLMAND